MRGAYVELIGFSKEVKLQFRNFMSPNIAGSNIGQVLKFYISGKKKKKKRKKGIMEGELVREQVL